MRPDEGLRWNARSSSPRRRCIRRRLEERLLDAARACNEYERVPAPASSLPSMTTPIVILVATSESVPDMLDEASRSLRSRWFVSGVAPDRN